MVLLPGIMAGSRASERGWLGVDAEGEFCALGALELTDESVAIGQ